MLENLPHLAIRHITVQPNFEAVARACLKLNTNAWSLHSSLRNGRIGLLCLTNTTICNTLSTVELYSPTNPGQNPTIPENATGKQIAETRRAHKEAHDEFTDHSNTEKSLKTQIISAFDETHIFSETSKYVCYANVTTLELLIHLYATNAKIARRYLRENEIRVSQQHDPNQPI